MPGKDMSEFFLRSGRPRSAAGPQAVQIIKDEHFAIAGVLYCLRYLVKQMKHGGAEPNFPLLRAILDYIVSYPDRWHHPKEDGFLFAAVKRRTREADALIANLEREHELGHPMIEELKSSLLGFQRGDPDCRQAFFDLAKCYVEFEWSHMRKEEDGLLPIALRCLEPDDWEEIDAAFRENDNPQFGIRPREEAERLYRKILDLAPPPIGWADGEH